MYFAKTIDHIKTIGLEKTLGEIKNHLSFKMKLRPAGGGWSIYTPSAREQSSVELKIKRLHIFAETAYSEGELMVEHLANSFCRMGWLVNWFYLQEPKEQHKGMWLLPLNVQQISRQIGTVGGNDDGCTGPDFFLKIFIANIAHGVCGKD